MKNYIDSSACEIVDALSSKKLTMPLLLEQLDEHRGQVNPDINAFDSISNKPEKVQKGLLQGLPLTVKDQIAVAGYPRNFGLDKPAKNECAKTASVVQKFIDAGATIIGKTHLPPYALDFQTFNKRAGRTNNPWDIERTPGGSSGGGAAAVASGMSYLDIGADLSGSLRIPAAYCGVFSLLPSDIGKIETDGLMLKDAHLEHFARLGPITRSLEDLGLAWSIMSGTKQPQAELTKVNIGVWKSEDDFVEPQIISKFEEITSVLSQQDLSVTSKSFKTLFNHQVYQTFGEIMGFETGAFIPAPLRLIMRFFGKSVTDRSPKFLKHVYSGYKRNKQAYQNALLAREELQKNFDHEYEEFDAILLPVCGVQPFKHRDPDSDRNGIRDYIKPFEIGDSCNGYLDTLTAFTVPVSLMGNPVITIPLGMDGNALPVGAQLVGKRGDEWRLLQVAKVVTQNFTMHKSPYLTRNH